MAVVTLSDVDAFGKLIPIQGTLPNGYEYGLNLGAGTFGATVTRVSNTVIVTTNTLLMVYGNLDSGILTLKLSIFDIGGSPDFGSPDLTMSLDHAGTVYDFQYIELPSDQAFAVQAVSGGAGCVWGDGFFWPMNIKRAGRDYRVLSGSFNCVLGTDAYPDFALTA